MRDRLLSSSYMQLDREERKENRVLAKFVINTSAGQPMNLSGTIRLQEEIKNCTGFKVLHCAIGVTPQSSSTGNQTIFYELRSSVLSRKANKLNFILGASTDSSLMDANFNSDLIAIEAHANFSWGYQKEPLCKMRFYYDKPEDINYFDWQLNVPPNVELVTPNAIDLVIEFFYCE